MITSRWYATFLRGVFVLSTLFLLTACPNTNQEQSLTQIQSQISVLSNEMRGSFAKTEEDRVALYKKLNDDLKSLQQNQADVSAASDELRSGLTAINAKLDEYNARMEKLTERLNGLETAFTERIAFLSDQVNEIGKETTISPGVPPERQPPSPAATPTPKAGALETPPAQPGMVTESNPEAAQTYHTAYMAYINGNFDTAIAGFQKYLGSYPNAEHTDQAHYWIAESFFSLGEFATALKEDDKFITQYPKSDKIPSAYLTKAEAYLKLDRQMEAVSHLEYIINQFPQSAAAQKAKERLRTLNQ